MAIMKTAAIDAVISTNPQKAYSQNFSHHRLKNHPHFLDGFLFTAYKDKKILFCLQGFFYFKIHHR
jgi:hypothetical protein